ncbi:patatin-like phospholipase family protein [Rhodanobacter sp. AS-Z3]|uniref:patatin-like phospholipase family protein n=1 Tax=Rhodanobacter sp. AS-Z3 TaxID=3031330 RepID=UPI00247904EC|nr:patatin-like phospholipase family protein [Rhodanobacter sp. AS-Z3]WEN15854.1 patatin-like phospholipase family protein [Rhodanobacter sp. AS-Z3]
MSQTKEALAPPDASAAMAEQRSLETRRERAAVDPQAPTIGLALSGGGVRSATFCLGLLRALARNGVLHRFDYLSTVSGGGYIGAAFGRLFNASTTPQQVEQGLANDRSLLLWWLRSNGRYLTPAGASDLLQAAAGQLRGFVATQFEVAVLLALVASIVVLPHLICYPVYAQHLPWLTMNLWWLGMAMLGWLAAACAFAYWWSRDPEDGSLAGDLAIVFVTATLGGYLVWQAGPLDANHGPGLLPTVGVILLAIPLTWLWTRIRGSHPAQQRVRYTISLTFVLKGLLLLLVLGVADLLSWFLAWLLQSGTLSSPALSGAGLLALLVAVARFALPALQPRNDKPSLARLPLALIANLCGLLLLGLLLLCWLSALQYLLFFMGTTTSAAQAWMRWLAVVLPCLAYAGLTGRNLQAINRSSLHAFYRSRIARTYVAVGNQPAAAAGPTRFPFSPLQSKDSAAAQAVVKVTELLDHDDVALTDYAPHVHGGPIHLINCCINQTVDDRTEAFNADRKGICLTIGPFGVETGTQPARTVAVAVGSVEPLRGTTLAEWIAISGAAAGSGMGSMTRPGIAVLTFLSGFRLGYWWRNRLGKPSLSWSLLGKSRAALQEMLARFPGLQGPVWYLSDGGHFDNTGVYALLKRELKLIVLADCGADPNYLFADAESLIRKARIDYAATIEFIDPATLPADRIDPALLARLGTPDSVMPGPGEQSLLLARIRYRSGNTGALLVVKPRQPPDSPLDLVGYANRDTRFPQQGTDDQFFDEAQWESYCQLGELLGRPLNGAALDAFPALVLAGDAARIGPLAPEVQQGAMSLRQRVTATVGASLGLSAIIGLALAGWQAWDAHLQQGIEQQKLVTDAARDLGKEIGSDMGFDAEMDASVQLFRSQAGAPPYPDSIRLMVDGLLDTLQTKCAELSPGKLAIACNNDLTLLGDGPTLTRWDRAMVGYRDWPPVVALNPDASIATNTMPVPPLPTHDVPTETAPGVVRQGHADSVAAAPMPAADAEPMPMPPPPPPPMAAAPAEPAPTRSLRPDRTSAEHGGAATVAVAPTSRADPAALAEAARRACTQGVSRRFVVYTQIYDETERASAEAVLPQLRDLGVATPGIENVTASAASHGRNLPFQWHTPTVLYSGSGTQCASAISAWLDGTRPFASTKPAQAVPFPLSIRGEPNVIELWIPSAKTP